MKKRNNNNFISIIQKKVHRNHSKAFKEGQTDIKTYKNRIDVQWEPMQDRGCTAPFF